VKRVDREKRENVWFIVNRSLVFAGAFALFAVQPALTLAVPSGGSAHARPVSAAPHVAVRNNSTNRGEVNVPSRFGGQMKPITMPQHFALHASSEFTPLPVTAYQRFAVRSPAYLWYPALPSPACASGFAGASSDRRQSDFTLGSLVDGKSNLFSSPNYSAQFARKSGADAAASNRLSLQAGIFSTACGASAFTNL
jgi:hypothetical protein